MADIDDTPAAHPDHLFAAHDPFLVMVRLLPLLLRRMGEIAWRYKPPRRRPALMRTTRCAVAAIALTALLSLLLTQPADACSCYGVPLRESIRAASAIFQGRVLAADEPARVWGDRYMVSFA